MYHLLRSTTVFIKTFFFFQNSKLKYYQPEVLRSISYPRDFSSRNKKLQWKDYFGPKKLLFWYL